MAAAGIDTGKCSSRPTEVSIDITSPRTKARRYVEALVDGKMVLTRVRDVDMEANVDDEGNPQGLQACSSSSSSSSSYSDLPPVLSQYAKQPKEKKKKKKTDASTSVKDDLVVAALEKTMREKRYDNASKLGCSLSLNTNEEQERKVLSDSDDSKEEYKRWSDMYEGDDYEEDREQMAALRVLFNSPPSPTAPRGYTVATRAPVEDAKDQNQYAGE